MNLFGEDNILTFNPEFVQENMRQETESLIVYTNKSLKLFSLFLVAQLAIDISFGVDSIINRNVAYIEMSRFYAEIGIFIV